MVDYGGEEVVLKCIMAVVFENFYGGILVEGCGLDNVRRRKWEREKKSHQTLERYYRCLLFYIIMGKKRGRREAANFLGKKRE